jgi:hypothetical protein
LSRQPTSLNSCTVDARRIERASIAPKEELNGTVRIAAFANTAHHNSVVRADRDSAGMDDVDCSRRIHGVPDRFFESVTVKVSSG